MGMMRNQRTLEINPRHPLIKALLVCACGLRVAAGRGVGGRAGVGADADQIQHPSA